jgi:hypothetical protein
METHRVSAATLKVTQTKGRAVFVIKDHRDSEVVRVGQYIRTDAK